MVELAPIKNISKKKKKKKDKHYGFPGSPVVKESALQHKRHRFNPWFGKVSYAAGKLSPCVTTTEVYVPRACTPQQGKLP